MYVNRTKEERGLKLHKYKVIKFGNNLELLNFPKGIKYYYFDNIFVFFSERYKSLILFIQLKYLLLSYGQKLSQLYLQFYLDSSTFNTPRRPFEKERIDH